MKMQVSKITINSKRKNAIGGEISTDCLLMIFKSPVVFRINGRELSMNGNSAIVYSAGFLREIRPASSRGICCDTVLFRLTAEEKLYAESRGLVFDSPFALGKNLMVTDLLRVMSAHSMRKSLMQSEFMELSMRLLFIALSEEKNPQPIDEIETIPRYAELLALRDSIYDEPMNEWSAEEMSADMGISRAYFHRLYQAAFGTTCIQDVIESRLLHAADLLRNSDKSVSKIAEECGYDSDVYFMRQFKQHKGCTPTEYRRRAKSE